MAACSLTTPARVQPVVAASAGVQSQRALAPAALRGAPFLGEAAALRTARAAGCRPARRTAAAAPCATLNLKEPNTGVEFPLVQNFWLGDAYRCVGATSKSKKIAFINVKVYAVSLYVEAEKAARELGVRDRGGFFDNDDDFCQALIDGGFIKVLQIQLVRKVEGQQLSEALAEKLEPRMRLAGEMATLDKFKAFFEGKELEKGTNILLMYRTDATLDVVLRPGDADYSKVVADASIASASLCRALFEIYLGSSSVVPEGRREWANGARALLDSEKVRRDSRKGGSG